ncbi:hypothetical protein HPP92_022896 [Vanilla planifolia]|uniref:Endonuclease/exonuclease/phosphatase domain-containing protein n=1 Tax=Vanilla planifolia TaxID=51239 RepID=A0A835PZ58_VANPL|nr:hypothetical protein HPP92_022896 [Vanilla planifolia]
MHSSRFFPCIRSRTSNGAIGAAMSFYGFNVPSASSLLYQQDAGVDRAANSVADRLRKVKEVKARSVLPSVVIHTSRMSGLRTTFTGKGTCMCRGTQGVLPSSNSGLGGNHRSLSEGIRPQGRLITVIGSLLHHGQWWDAEVDRFYDLEGELAVRGYTGIWKMRTGNAVDGCAIFWRTTRFQLLHEEHIEYSKLGLRDNVAQICVLESKMQCQAPSLPASSDGSSEASQVVVCNIHVLYNPKRGEIKLGQVRVLLDRAYAVSRAWNDAPVVVCGDFNSTPTSPLYKFIAEQKVNLLGLTRAQISGQYSAILNNQTKYYSSYSARSSGLGYNGRSDDSQRGTYRIEPYNQTFLGNSSYGTSAVTLSHGIPQQNDGQISSGVAEVVLGEAENFESQDDKLSSYTGLGSLSVRTSESFSQQSINHVSLEDDKNKAEAVKEVGDLIVENKINFYIISRII